jgi:transposase
MNKISAIKLELNVFAVDIAKLKFQVHGYDAGGERKLVKTLTRTAFLDFFRQRPPPVKVFMEACGSAHHWARQLIALGHQPELVPPHLTKQYRIGNKHDASDADAIKAAVVHTRYRAVPIKAVQQQDLMLTQLERDRLVKQRTALTNQLRGVLAERGMVFAKGLKALHEGVRERLARAPDPELTAYCLRWLQRQFEEWQHLDECLKACDRQMKQDYRDTPRCHALGEVDGIGPQSALTFLALVGDGAQFPTGRAVAAWAGLTPREESTGQRRHLGSITKRGDGHLRRLLINGGRSLVTSALRKVKNGLALNARDTWLLGLVKRAGFNKACVAMANKNARILWAVLRTGEAFRSPLMAA